MSVLLLITLMSAHGGYSLNFSGQTVLLYFRVFEQVGAHFI